MRTLHFFVALSSLSLLALAGGAQTKPVKSKESPPAKTEVKDRETARAEAESEITRLQQRAVSLIRDAARESVTIEDRRSIARIQLLAADALWKYDREQARELFEKAFETAVTHYRETKDDDTEKVGGTATVRRSDMRQEVIRKASLRDTALGKRMTDRYVEEKQREIEARPSKSPSGGKSNDAMLGSPSPAADQLLSIAQSLIDSDRQTSLELAQRAIIQGVSVSTPNFLASLASRDRTAADQLFFVALERVGREQFVVPGQLLMLSAYPFGEGRVWMTDGRGTSSYGFGTPSKFELDPALIARFLAAAGDILARTMEINPAQFPDLTPRLATALFAARMLEPKVAQYQPALLEKWPALISRLHAATAEASRDGISRTLDNMAREQQRSASPDTSDRVKDILERAEKTADFARRDELYAQAAQEARRGGDTADSLSIADKISDMDYRQKVRDWLNFNASSDALSDNRPEDARRYAINVSATDQCAYLLFQIAASALKGRDRARAIDLLEEAARRASDAANTIEKLRALLGIANLYAGIDPSRAFDIASEAVKTANKVSGYSLDQARLVRVLARPSGGSVSISSNDVDGFDIGKTLAVLARSDFERTLSLAQSLENKSLQLTTIVTVATTLIDQKPTGQ
jgi:hypothetical protein